MAKSADRSTGSSQGATYRCGECGWQTAKWVGRCGECQAWGTVEARRRRPAAAPGRRPARSRAPRCPSARSTSRRPPRARPGSPSSTGCSAAGSCPGPWCCSPASPASASPRCCSRSPRRPRRSGRRALYVTGEESAAQVRLRADRIGALDPLLFLAAETDLGAVLGHVDAVAPDAAGRRLGADHRPRARSTASPGGVTQVREVAAALIQVAKERGIATVLVGHVTKDGAIAGPRVLEHLVDVVLHFEGERHSRLRLVRAVKNRYGPADEVGCFDLGDDGIVGLPDPSGLFLSHGPGPRRAPASPSPSRVGGRWSPRSRRSSPSAGGRTPRRATTGLDAARVAMVLAVLERGGLKLRLATPTSTPPPSAAYASPSPPPTWPSRSRSPPRPTTCRSRWAWSSSARSAWPARSAG